MTLLVFLDLWLNQIKLHIEILLYNNFSQPFLNFNILSLKW